ncbi:MAG: DNA polymerase III subunit gamma/tau, partial [Candidatus Omnitrophica bacterium]|nr:DNA polymerase III subunit gamma/tau [Candidatus Omnitrophota bacterium]
MTKKKEPQENYLIFARKFRPQTFEEVVGQEPITTTLKNAISKGRIAQSFLFTGSRGIGKTSTARIFAKALNCEKGSSPTPCNQCSICEEITQGISLDVLEIDGASNRGIDEIRNLRENVKFKPTRGKYKVYIIDEVHMLTGEAFNALLKTLEEPPEHVKFVFATTEVHKVPLTILSRCQRFNFRRIPTEEIVEKLKEIAKQEKIKVSAKALFMIAKSSEGSLRDAESLLDQLASFGGGEIKESDITFSLGLTDSDLYFSLLEALKAKQASEVLRLVGEVAEQGKDLVQFSKGLLELFRNLLVLAIGEGTEKLIEGADDELDWLKKMKSAFSREELLFALTLLQQLSREIRWSDTPRFLVETCLLKIASRADLRSIDDILKELKSLQKNSSEGLVTQPRIESPQALLREPEEKKEHFEVKKDVVASVAKQSTDCHSRESGNLVPRLPHKGAASLKHSGMTESDQAASSLLRTPPRNDERTNSKGSSITLSDIGRVWPELLERVKATKMSCGTYLSESEPVEVVEGLVVFGFPNELKFHTDAIEKQYNKVLVRSTLKSLLGQDVN